MDIATRPIDRTPAHVSRGHAPGAGAAPSATSQAGSSPDTTGSQSNAAPSFSAVFAGIAAAAAAAGTTVASTASPTGGAPIPATAAATPAATAAAVVNGDPASPLFGANPWVANPTGSGPDGTTNYNPIYFATQQTAQAVAQMVGGTVVSANEITSAPGSPFQQDQPNLMVQLPNGGLINPGLVADIYTHGWNQSFVNQQVANEVASAAPAASTIGT